MGYALLPFDTAQGFAEERSDKKGRVPQQMQVLEILPSRENLARARFLQ